MASLSDIAKAAGVSTATASRALNGHGPAHRIAPATVNRIKAVAAKLGYTPSYHARALRTQRAGAIGVVINSGSLLGRGQGWFGGILGGLDQAIRQAGSNLLLISDRDKSAILDDAWAALREGRVDGLVIFDHILSRYKWSGTQNPLPDDERAAVVVIGERHETGHAQVRVEAGPGVDEAIRILAGRGHRRFAWIGLGKEGRVHHAVRAAAEVGVDLVSIALPDLRREMPTGEHIALELGPRMGELADVTAVLCFNDLVAIPVMGLLSEAGRQPGRDVAVVGVDDVVAEQTWPPLSSVRLPISGMGRRAAEIILSMHGGPEQVAPHRGQVHTLPGTFVERASSREVVIRR